MTWDEQKNTSETRPDVPAEEKITASDYNAMVADQKGHSSRHEETGSDSLGVFDLVGSLTGQGLERVGDSLRILSSIWDGENITANVNNESVHTESAGIADTVYAEAGDDDFEGIFEEHPDGVAVVVPQAEITTTETIQYQETLGIAGRNGRAGSVLSKSFNGDLLVLGGPDGGVDCKIRDLDLEGNDATGAAIKIIRGRNFHFHDLYINGFDHAVEADANETTQDTLIDHDYYHLVAEQCNDHGVVFRASLNNNKNIRRVSFHSGYSFGNAGDGVLLDGRGIQRVKFTDYESRDNTGVSARLRGARGCRFTSCEFGNDVVLEEDDEGFHATETQFTGCDFSNNIELRGSSNAMITGGRINGSPTVSDGASMSEFNIWNLTGWRNIWSGEIDNASHDVDIDLGPAGLNNIDDALQTVIIIPDKQAAMVGARSPVGGVDTQFRPQLRDESGTALSDVDINVIALGETHPRS